MGEFVILVSDNFKEFCSNLKMSEITVSTIQSIYHQITKRINLDYCNSCSKINNNLYVNLYGRKKAFLEHEIDVILPNLIRRSNCKLKEDNCSFK